LKASLRLTDVPDKDELTLYIRGRYNRGTRQRNEDLDTSATCLGIVIQNINIQFLFGGVIRLREV